MAMSPKLVLLIIFTIALMTRFSFFKDSIYFGFDEARDAHISQSIYKESDLKIVGPPANYPGLFHGPLFWYLVGPMYLLADGDPIVVSAIFRVINALGVLLVFLTAKKLFNPAAGLTAALIYSVSFEQTQYAMYVGNPSLAVLSITLVFLGASILKKDKRPQGLILMAIGTAISIQLELILLYILAVAVILLLLTRDILKSFKQSVWLWPIILLTIILSTFLVAELKYDFQSTKAFIELLRGGYNVLPQNESKLSLYINMLSQLFQYNILSISSTPVSLATGVFVLTLTYLARRDKSVALVLVWVLATSLLLPFGGYNAFYVNVGVGVGIIMGFSYLLVKLKEKNKYLFIATLGLVVFSNLSLIRRYSKDGLIVEIKAQQFMKLKDEIITINKTYEEAKGKGFTIRVTSMPYKIQTVWAYLYNQYGEKKWGYLPFWETGNVEGYPGILPGPIEGTTCTRFLIREPVRGIPEVLIQKDREEEDLFSDVVSQEQIGHFLLQIRKAKGSCHGDKAL